MFRIAAMIGMLAAGPASIAQEPTVPAVPAIVTNGEAILHRAADQAFVTVAVEARARNPRDAQQQNAASMTAVLQRLAAAGLAKDAIRTLGYTVQQDADFINGRR